MNHFRVVVGPKDREHDVVGRAVLHEIKDDLGSFGIKNLFVAIVFDIVADVSEQDVFGLCRGLFVDPVCEVFSVNRQLFDGFDFSLQVSLHSNVTDNVGIIARRGMEDFLKRKLGESESVRSARLYFFEGDVSEDLVLEIAKKLLSNPLIEEARILREKNGTGFTG